MALDNADFISELSIVDPPGTDPVNQGDDQIRTVKRATQQSFPNIDAAVPQSAAQMAQMAIKNEVNTFTQTNIFTPDQTFTAGATFGNRPTVAGVAVALLSANTFTGFQTFAVAGTRFFNFANSIQKTGDTQIGGITYEDAAGFGRWLLGMSTAGNSERFFLQRRDAGGISLGNVWEANLTDGSVVAFNREMRRSVDTVNSVIFWKTAGLVTRHTLNFEATGGFNPQSLTFSAFNTGGTFIANTLRFGGGGELFMENLPTVNPGGSNRLWNSGGFVAIT